ncbi:MAG: hypothetical protein MJB57_02435 [Gemmatimonadetes bacterium]|nr:hypothetical protein [Gemmatimonadota bacterium]
MDALPPDRQRYGDRDIARILKRASELQRAEPTRPDPSGLTLAELEEVAVEAGIERHNLRRAVSELDARGGSATANRWFGAPTKFRLERVLSGELTSADFGRIASILQSATDKGGQATHIGHTLTWTSVLGNSSRTLRGLIESDRGETRVRFEEAWGQLAGGLFGGLAGGAGGGIGLPAAIGITAGGAPLAGLAIGAVVVGGSWALARFIYKTMCGKRTRELTELFDRIVGYVEEAVARRALEAEDPASLS